MSLTVRCNQCDSVHRLSKRNGLRGTTACPDCGDTPYTSAPRDLSDHEKQRAQRERLDNELQNVDGVGMGVRENITDRYKHVDEVREVGVDGLTNVPYVGETVAERIVSRLA